MKRSKLITALAVVDKWGDIVCRIDGKGLAVFQIQESAERELCRMRVCGFPQERSIVRLTGKVAGRANGKK